MDTTTFFDRGTTLFVPERRRFAQHTRRREDGGAEVVVYFGDKEICFDEPDLFPFAARLCATDRFVAESATTWSGGEPYAWERVKGYLEALVSEGIVTLDEGASEAASESPRCLRHREAEAVRRAPDEALWWSPDCASVMRAVAGRPLELGYLETVVAVHRVAHPALDRDRRHVGEMNVFPAAMRMRLATETRPCRYAGSRYRYDLPMNVTALHAMRAHWRPMLHGVLAVRREFVARYPLGGGGVMTLGDLHALACAQLAFATLPLVRAVEPVANGDLDPALSSMHRACDGVRMVAAYALLFLDDPRPYDSPITAAELLRLTEERGHFLSEHGVCAGPPNMIGEFLATLVDGQALADDAPPLGDQARDVPRAIDYALLGIMLRALTSTLWLRMMEAYERLRATLADAEPVADAPLARLRERVERDWASAGPSHLDRPAQRAWEERRFAELFERAQRGLRGAPEARTPTLPDVLSPAAPRGEHPDPALRGALEECAGPGAASRALDDIAGALGDYLRVERAVLAAVDGVQRRVNALLGREHPRRPLTGMDLALYHTLSIGTDGALPYLLHAVRDALDLEVENSASATTLTPRRSIDLRGPDAPRRPPPSGRATTPEAERRTP